MNVFYRFFRVFFTLYFKLCYRFRVYGSDYLPQGAAIIAPNHTSYLDPPLAGVACPEELAYLASHTLFNLPLLGWVIKKLNAQPIAAGGGGDTQSIKMMCSLLEKGKKMLIFPEGERRRDGTLGEVRRGLGLIALKSGAPIIPCYIDGAYRVWPVRRLFPKLWGRVSCRFAPPIYPLDFVHLDKKNAQKEIAEAVYRSLKKLESESV